MEVLSCLSLLKMPGPENFDIELNMLNRCFTKKKKQ